MLATGPPLGRAPLAAALIALSIFALAAISPKTMTDSDCTCVAGAPLANMVEENAPGTGSWGGECKCPDGAVYLVADNDDYCSSLACVGGSYIGCTQRTAGPWSHRRVTCAPSSPPPAHRPVPQPPVPQPPLPPPLTPEQRPPLPMANLWSDLANLTSPTRIEADASWATGWQLELQAALALPRSRRELPRNASLELCSALLAVGAPLLLSSAMDGVGGPQSTVLLLIGAGALLGVLGLLLVQAACACCCAPRGGRLGPMVKGSERGASHEQLARNEARGGSCGGTEHPPGTEHTSGTGHTPGTGHLRVISEECLGPTPGLHQSALARVGSDDDSSRVNGGGCGGYHQHDGSSWRAPEQASPADSGASSADLSYRSPPPIPAWACKLEHGGGSRPQLPAAVAGAAGWPGREGTGWAGREPLRPTATAPSTGGREALSWPRSHVPALVVPPPSSSVRLGGVPPSCRASSRQPRQPRQPAAPSEQQDVDGQLSLSGPTADGGWQCLVYLPSIEAMRYDVSHPLGGASLKLHVRGVLLARWEALVRCTTMAAWQAAVSKLLSDARAEHRVGQL